jgi:2-methylisocitrate lyase-like PEP mutase family enzyme
MTTPFVDLHRGPDPLLLPNAWDVPSALVLAAEGYAALGTTSLGVASSLGRPDGRRATREANLDLAGRLRSLPVLLSVDIEDGYSEDPAEVARYVGELARLGVAGVNLEDSFDERLVEPAAVAAKVEAVKATAPDVFVNARVDTYWFHQDDTVAATVARATSYLDAGADGIFVPGASDDGVLRDLASALPAPVNVLPVPGRTLAELGRLGVRRVSSGSLPYRAALTAAAEAVASVRDGRPAPGAITYPALQELLAGHDAASS